MDKSHPTGLRARVVAHVEAGKQRLPGTGQSRHAQKYQSGKSHTQGRMLVPVLAILQAQPQSHRNDVLQVQKTPTPNGCTHLHRHV